MRSVNLLPEHRRWGAAMRARVVALCGGGPLALATVGSGLLFASASLSADLGPVHAGIAETHRRIASADAERAALARELATIRWERAAREALAARPVWGGLTHRLAEVVAPHGSLESLTIGSVGGDRPGPGEAAVGFDVTLAGRSRDAASLTRLLPDLEAIGLFDRVVLVASARVRETGEDPAVRFEIRCSIIGGHR